MSDERTNERTNELVAIPPDRRGNLSAATLRHVRRDFSAANTSRADIAPARRDSNFRNYSAAIT